MQQRKLGRSPLQVSALGLGLMSMSGVYGNADDAQSIALIHHALGRGVNFLDSADMYGWGHNEELLGKALKGKRDQAIVATKFGQTKGADGKQGIDGSPAYVQKACEASLKRLGIDSIDLYYQHRVDPATPIEDTVGAMKRLVEQGKVRALGLSEAAPDTIRRAHKVHPIAAVQNEYSLLYRKDGEETLAACRSLGISLVAYAPLGRSMLTGTVHGKADLPEGDRRLAHPRFQGESLEKNVSLAMKLEAIAREKKCTTPQLVIAWLLAQGEDIVPIPGTKRKERFDENLAALQIKLSPEDVKRISEAAPVGAGAGTRYPAEAMKRVFV
jgi:aryl-alcohol dehydrogenase-like predicted oxidoreductase